MNTRPLGIGFKPGLDRKTGELLAEIASSSQRISAPDGAKKFSLPPHVSGEPLSRSRGALQATIGESLAESAGSAEIPAAAAAASPGATAWRLENSVPAAPVPRNVQPRISNSLKGLTHSGRTGGISGRDRALWASPQSDALGPIGQITATLYIVDVYAGFATYMW
jgi:hypothetical protein